MISILWQFKILLACFSQFDVSFLKFLGGNMSLYAIAETSHALMHSPRPVQTLGNHPPADFIKGTPEDSIP